MVRPDELPDLTPDLLEERPLAQAETLPSAWYVDPRFGRLDRAAVFARTWQYVGHAGRVAEHGMVLSARVAGHPVMVVRDGDTLRAFYNVCRHRGGPLVAEDCRRDRVFKCGYHGWTYRLDGSLRGVPAMDRVELFDHRDFGLVSLPVGVWEGLVFVALDPAVPPLQEVFAGMRERIAPVALGSMRFAHRVHYDVACNWKTYVDNYLEGYHVPIVHPELTKLYDFQSYVTEVADWYSLQLSPLSGEANLYDDGSGRAWYYHVFPNFMLNILPGRLQTNRVLPTGPTTCRVEFEYFYEDLPGREARGMVRQDVEFSDGVQQEDIGICEHVQRGLESPGYDRGRFSVKYEAGVWHFQRLVKRAYGAWLRNPRPPGPPPSVHAASGASPP
jgi:choline monooxygenase